MNDTFDRILKPLSSRTLTPFHEGRINLTVFRLQTVCLTVKTKLDIFRNTAYEL